MGGIACVDSVVVNDIQVVFEQQAAVADAAAATAGALTDNTDSGAPTGSIEDCRSTVGTVTVYTPTATGNVTIQSGAVTDLDDTQAGLELLTSQVNTRMSTINSRLACVDQNFTDTTDQINNLIIDVADISTQFNSLLAALRVHGLIAT